MLLHFLVACLQVVFLVQGTARAAPSSGSALAADIATLADRRKADLAGSVDPASYALIPGWLRSQTSQGTWTDVDYTSGCAARELSTTLHLLMHVAEGRRGSCSSFRMASSGSLDPDHRAGLRVGRAGSGLAPQSGRIKRCPRVCDQGHDLVVQQRLHRPGLSRPGRHRRRPVSLRHGGDVEHGPSAVSAQACHSLIPDLQNWYSSVLLIPRLVSTTCLLLWTAPLSDAHRRSCIAIPQRVYDRRDTGFTGVSTLDSANVGVDRLAFATDRAADRLPLASWST